MQKKKWLEDKEEKKIRGIEKKAFDHYIPVALFELSLSFPVFSNMVLSLTVDELVQAHFDALVEEGRQKQVRRSRLVFYRSPCSRLFNLSPQLLPLCSIFSRLPPIPKITGRPRRGEVRLQARPRRRVDSNSSCRRKWGLSKLWRERRKKIKG